MFYLKKKSLNASYKAVVVYLNLEFTNILWDVFYMFFFEKILFEREGESKAFTQ